MMRVRGPRSAALIVATLVLGCGGPAGPTASGSVLEPSTEPTPSQVPPPTGPAPSTSPGAGPTTNPASDAEIYAIDCRGDGPCTIEFVPNAVSDEPGWPVLVGGPCRGTMKAHDGTSYAACDTTEGVLVHAWDQLGMWRPGWPVGLPGVTASVYENDLTIGCGATASAVVRSDGRIVVATVEASAAMLHVLTPAGVPIDGWPQPFPGDPPGEDGVGGNGCRGFAILSDDAILAWGYEGVEADILLVADRTEFTVYEADGRLRAGWPLGSVGAASRPVVLRDGSVAYVSASGRVWRHLPDGERASGWPYQLPAQTEPWLAPDGRLVFLIQDASGEDRAVALTADGIVVRGWPISLGAAVESRCLFGDTPCIGRVDPVFGPDGMVYVALANSTIAAIHPDGSASEGWPVPVGVDGHAVALTIAPNGNVLADVVVCEQLCSDAPVQRIELSPAGDVLTAG